MDQRGVRLNMAMHVIFPGPRTTIQDKGRLGHQNSGFAPGGFMDRVASKMANALVGTGAILKSISTAGYMPPAAPSACRPGKESAF